MYDWSYGPIHEKRKILVSVVVERMYDWSKTDWWHMASALCFSCCWKDVRLKLLNWGGMLMFDRRVSVVVERMYDWSREIENTPGQGRTFQLLLKGCTIEAFFQALSNNAARFQLLLKGCTIEALIVIFVILLMHCFSCCWKDVRLKLKSASSLS